MLSIPSERNRSLCFAFVHRCFSRREKSSFIVGSVVCCWLWRWVNSLCGDLSTFSDKIQADELIVQCWQQIFYSEAAASSSFSIIVQWIVAWTRLLFASRCAQCEVWFCSMHSASLENNFTKANYWELFRESRLAAMAFGRWTGGDLQPSKRPSIPIGEAQ